MITGKMILQPKRVLYRRPPRSRSAAGRKLSTFATVASFCSRLRDTGKMISGRMIPPFMVLPEETSTADYGNDADGEQKDAKRAKIPEPFVISAIFCSKDDQSRDDLAYNGSAGNSASCAFSRGFPTRRSCYSAHHVSRV
jgi:hypothetical protein